MTPETARLLRKARKLLARTSHLAAPTSKGGKISTPTPAAYPPPASGPINLYMKLEGRRFASDLVLSARALLRTQAGTQELIGNLQRACASRPASYAAGIAEIIDLIRLQETANAR